MGSYFAQDPFKIISWKSYILVCTSYKQCKKYYKGNIRYTEYVDDLRQQIYLKVMENIITYKPEKKTKKAFTDFEGITARIKFTIPFVIIDFFKKIKLINANERLTAPEDLYKYISTDPGPDEQLLLKEYFILASKKRRNHGR